eukprot:UN04360
MRSWMKMTLRTVKLKCVETKGCKGFEVNYESGDCCLKSQLGNEWEPLENEGATYNCEDCIYCHCRYVEVSGDHENLVNGLYTKRHMNCSDSYYNSVTSNGASIERTGDWETGDWVIRYDSKEIEP